MERLSLGKAGEGRIESRKARRVQDHDQDRDHDKGVDKGVDPRDPESET